MGIDQYSLILKSLRYFDRSGLFEQSNASDSVISSTAHKIASIYDNIAQGLLSRADGDQEKADYLYNTSYFNYYYRLEQFQKWSDEQQKRIEAIGNKG